MTDLTLRIKDLKLGFKTAFNQVEVLHGIDMHIRKGERVALVGESGSGKSVTARIVLGILQELRSSRITGQVEFQGRDITTMAKAERLGLRGRDMSMIFQDPTSSLNPVFKISELFHEVLKRRTPGISAADSRARAVAMLQQVSIHEPERALDSYAFQLSGGMNQRIMIAMSLANEPSLLLADEPGTALDVTVQAQTLELMRDMVEQKGTSVLFISHNLGVVREFADRVYVIYKGRIVEHGTTASLFADPRHAYTRALMSAVPRITGQGIPDTPEFSESFYDPIEVHDGLSEPEAAA